MKHRLIWTAIIVVFAFLFGFGLYVAKLNYAGYCFAEDKYLSDAEKIRKAVEATLKNYPPSNLIGYRHDLQRDDQVPQPAGQVIHYSSVDEFYSLNPECCAVSPVVAYKGSESYGAEFREKVTGTISGFVYMNYSVRYKDTNAVVQSIKVVSYLPISNCGEIVTWWRPLLSDVFFH